MKFSGISSLSVKIRKVSSNLEQKYMIDAECPMCVELNVWLKEIH